MTCNSIPQNLTETLGRKEAPNLNLDIKVVNDSDVSVSTSSCNRLYHKSVNLVFSDVSYSVRTGLFSQERRKLLSYISGDFRPGELTAIMGLSGAGKSTLLDILAGFTTCFESGNVMVNGINRDLGAFRRSSTYIMQDDNLQPLLTVQEAMEVSADLKLDTPLSEKKKSIDQILLAMGLAESRRTLTSELSGGQRKRLAMALELINNPPIMFFDEPTSGLDSVTSRQCVELLKALAREGRTVICTIHQLSATLSDMIDHLYVVADGSCVYTGGTKNLVNFLASLQLHCPTYYNPADFILEVCNGDYGNHMPKLIRLIENGKSNLWRSPADDEFCTMRKMIAAVPMTPISVANLPSPITPVLRRIQGKNAHIHPTGFWKQLYILVKRNAIQLSRDRVLTFMRILMHFIIAILVGTLYFKIGQDANYALDNCNLLFFGIMSLIFNAFSATLITFPLEVPILTREHFNRWYKLRAFYLANKLADFPVQITAALMYTLIVYYMSGQVPEGKRIILFVSICIAVTLVAQTAGLILGISMKIQNAVIFGPLVILPFTIFSGFFVHLHHAHPYLQWLFHISFVKYGFEGVMVAIYGYERPKMKCSVDYCHFSNPKLLLAEVDMKDSEYWFSMAMLIVIYIFLDTSAFLLLRLRLKQRFYR